MMDDFVTNRKKIQRFTEYLYDLFVIQKISLKGVLEILAEKPEIWIKNTSSEVLGEMKEGNLFSNALSKCERIRFDPTYIAFIFYAEKTGNLADAVCFLKKRCERKAENRQKVISAIIYPVFVIFFALIFSGFICFRGNRLFDLENFDWNKLTEDYFKYVFLLLVFCLVSVFLIKKYLGENKIYEAFLGINFLVKSGIDLGVAVGYGILVTGPENFYGHIFERARERLEYGMDLQSAFSLVGDTESNQEILNRKMSFYLVGRRNRKWIKELDNALFFAHKAGEKSNAFEKICRWMEIEDEKRRKICISLLEPFFILVTGIFVFAIMINFMLPLINNTSFLS